ncbi:uncharacterized protein LOC109536824 [Dendroctonus ponderosae]|nr:uncharacterized protein LOC109536824 [Dendroctonus ponderosae]
MVMDNIIITNENLQSLMIRTLQRQADDEEFHIQMKNTLIYLTTTIDRFLRTTSSETQDNFSTPIAKLSKFTITVSKSSLSQCHSDVKNNSLVSLNGIERNEAFDTSTNYACSLHSDLLLHGAFGRKILCQNISSDKATQYYPSSYSLTESKLIQTHFISLAFFDIKGFKLNLLRHIRALKQDVATLRELLPCVEEYQSRNCFDARSLAEPKTYFYPDDEFEFKFIQAKTRATNFVKFYKLRKLCVSKKSSRKRIKQIT